MLKLKRQYFGHLMQRTDSFEKTVILGKIEGRKRGQERMRWLDDITDSVDLSLGKLGSCWWTGRPGMLRFLGSQRVGHDWMTELNWFLENIHWFCRYEFNFIMELCYKTWPFFQGSEHNVFKDVSIWHAYI